jgi:hypothetical protein
MGNVSHAVPAIHPYIKTCEKSIPAHTREFAESTISPYALDSMIKGACALALTGYDIITNPGILSEIKKEFELQKGLL